MNLKYLLSYLKILTEYVFFYENLLIHELLYCLVWYFLITSHHPYPNVSLPEGIIFVFFNKPLFFIPSLQLLRRKLICLIEGKSPSTSSMNIINFCCRRQTREKQKTEEGVSEWKELRHYRRRLAGKTPVFGIN